MIVTSIGWIYFHLTSLREIRDSFSIYIILRIDLYLTILSVFIFFIRLYNLAIMGCRLAIFLLIYMNQNLIIFLLSKITKINFVAAVLRSVLGWRIEFKHLNILLDNTDILVKSKQGFLILVETILGLNFNRF